MTSKEIREKFLRFFEQRGHKIIPPAPLVLEGDPTTLFTSSGMQPLLPFFLGASHPEGLRLANVQKCFRSQDIEEVGDNRHTTFFEMLGNWSFGDYFKSEQLNWLFEFLVEELQLDPARLYPTVFAGDEQVPRDRETADIWKEIFAAVGIEAKEVEAAAENGMQGGRIFYYGADKNWWSREGTPEKMSSGEPGGPDSEVFYDFGAELKIHENSVFRDQVCHPNCDCGRFVEIGNSVFMSYKKKEEGGFEELPKKNIDFGGGLERIAAATQNQPDLFQTEDFIPLIAKIEELGVSYKEDKNRPGLRIIADHLKAATFILAAGVIPSNKERGYLLRRLIRRALRFAKILGIDQARELGPRVAEEVICRYGTIYPELVDEKEQTLRELVAEEERFEKVLARGLKEFEGFGDDQRISGKEAFDLYQNYGFPIEMVEEMARERGFKIKREEFERARGRHQEVSKRGREKRFVGGLSDHSSTVVQLHTAAHLLHSALREVLGKNVWQRGQNITAERLRFDFSHSRALRQKEIERIEEIVNNKIKAGLEVWSKELALEEARRAGAIGLFDAKYGERVKVYYIGRKGGEIYSQEFCNGPHVKNTSELARFKIIQEESAGAGIRRIRAIPAAD